MSKPVRHGSKWRVRWTDHNGKRRSEVYEARADALFKLNEHRHHVGEVERNLRLPDPPKKTFDEVADYWLTVQAAGKRSLACDKSIIRAHLRPAFGGMLVSRIGTEEIQRLKASKAHLHPNTLHHILTLLISLLRMALDLNWLRVMPKVKKPKIKLFSKDFHYLSTKEEVARLLRSAKEEGELEFVLYATALYTGMRQGELASLCWSGVDFEKRLILVATSWGGPTKNGEARHVPILDVLLPILREWRLKCPGKFVFPNSEGGMFLKCARIFQESLHSILDRAEFPKVQRHGKERRFIRFHDLRHSFASAWMVNGGDLFRLQSILGHATPQMTMRYAHLAPAAFSADWGRLGTTTPAAPGAVLPFSLEAGASLA